MAGVEAPDEGRVLRSPTVFEDVVKTICTVNIQWGGTVSMVKRLAGVYGQAPAWDPDAASSFTCWANESCGVPKLSYPASVCDRPD